MQAVSTDTVLFHHGDACCGFHLLLERTIHIYRLSPEGRILVPHVTRPGESFAEVPLFEDQGNSTYPATAETLLASTLLFFPAEAFLSFVNALPRSALHTLGQLDGWLRGAVQQLDALSLHDVQERLTHHLVEQDERENEESEAHRNGGTGFLSCALPNLRASPRDLLDLCQFGWTFTGA